MSFLENERDLKDDIYAIIATAPDGLFSTPHNAAAYMAKKLREMGW